MDTEDDPKSSDLTSHSDVFSKHDFQDSDIASSTITDRDHSELEKDYWFGKKYFRCVLAQDVLSQSTKEESIRSIDSKLQTAIQRFNYEETIHSLRAQGFLTSRMSLVSQERSNFEILLEMVGYICRYGATREKRALLIAIRNGETGSSLEFADQKPSKHPVLQDRQTPARTKGTGSVTDIGFYTLTLKEHLDQVGVIPYYEVETKTLVPPYFVAKLSFNGSSFQGSSSTKKGARHAASMKACENLNLKHPSLSTA